MPLSVNKWHFTTIAHSLHIVASHLATDKQSQLSRKIKSKAHLDGNSTGECENTAIPTHPKHYCEQQRVENLG